MMRYFASIALGISLAAGAYGPAFAQATGMKNGSNDATTSKARCSPGDPNVMLNVKTKTYMLDKSKAVSKMTGSSMTSSTGMTDANASKTPNMKSVCKSEAESMGAKMAAAAH